MGGFLSNSINNSGGAGGSVGSSYSSQPVTTTNNTTDLSRVDNRVASNGGVFGGDIQLNAHDIQAPINFSTTDQGTVLAARDIALESIRGIESQVGATQSIARDSISQAYDLAQQARQSETSASLNNFLKYGAYIAAAALIAWVLVKSK